MKKYIFKFNEDGEEKEVEIESDSIQNGLVKLIETTKGNKLLNIKVYCKGEIKDDSNKKSKRGRKKSE